MRRALTIAIGTWLCAAVPAAGPAAETRAESGVDLPLTLEKLWYREGGKRRQGDLTIGPEGLEFVTRKRAFSIPLERIQFISFGAMKGDVDTEWVVLSVGVARPWDLVGFRDGKLWGFGGRTLDIYNRMRRALQQLSVGQYRVAPGYQAYEDPDRGCALAVPEDWSTYVESLVLTDGRAPGGTTVFSERPIREIEKTADGGVRTVDDLELLDAIFAGESPGFFLERSRAGRGMTCRGFSESARERVLSRAREDLVFGEEYETLQAPATSAHVVGGCDALRILGRSRRPDGREVVLEAYAVASGDTLYFLGIRALADRYEEARKPFAAAVETVRFGGALPR